MVTWKLEPCITVPYSKRTFLVSSTIPHGYYSILFSTHVDVKIYNLQLKETCKKKNNSNLTMEDDDKSGWVKGGLCTCKSVSDQVMRRKLIKEIVPVVRYSCNQTDNDRNAFIYFLFK